MPNAATPRRSKLDRHGPELAALRRAGASRVELARWLDDAHGVQAASSTVGRWLHRARYFCAVQPTEGFDAAAVLDDLRARSRRCRFPRYAPSKIDPYGHRVLRMRRDGASVNACHRFLTTECRLRVARSTVLRWLRSHDHGR